MGRAVKSLFGGGKAPDTSAIEASQRQQREQLDRERADQEKKIDARLAVRRRGRSLLEYTPQGGTQATLGGGS